MQPKCNPKGRGVVDEALALAELQDFAAKLKRAGELWSPFGGSPASDAMYDAVRAEIHKSLQLVKEIASEYDKELAGRIDHGVNYGSGHVAAIAATNELIGILESAEKRAAILGTQGPKLAAANMHPWVWGAAAQLWDDGHHREAVSKAASAIFDVYLPDKVQMSKGTKAEAMIGQAFSGATPFLNIPGFATPGQDRTNAYDGASNLGLACSKLVRNLATHNVTAPGDEDELLEELAMLSRFARIVDSSTV